MGDQYQKAQDILSKYSMGNTEDEGRMREGIFMAQIGQRMIFVVIGNVQSHLPLINGYKQIIIEIMNWASKQKR